MRFITFIIWINFVLFASGSEKEKNGGLIWIMGEPWTYQMVDELPDRKINEHWGEMVNSAKAEFAGIFKISQDDVSVIKIVRRSDIAGWFDVYLAYSKEIKSLTASVGSSPVAKIAAVIPVRGDGQLGKKIRLEDNHQEPPRDRPTIPSE